MPEHEWGDADLPRCGLYLRNEDVAETEARRVAAAAFDLSQHRLVKVHHHHDPSIYVQDLRKAAIEAHHAVGDRLLAWRLLNDPDLIPSSWDEIGESFIIFPGDAHLVVNYVGPAWIALCRGRYVQVGPYWWSVGCLNWTSRFYPQSKLYVHPRFFLDCYAIAPLA